jgi:predicted Rossmann fold nucleotide-binding protein DprA/Smf involved in DNA uptake
LPVFDEAVNAMKERLAEIERSIGPLMAEAEQLRDAIGRLDDVPRGAGAGAGGSRARRRRAPAVAGTPPRRRGSRAAAKQAPRGQNRKLILGAIATEAKTASVVAKETGIKPGTVSSTLIKLAKDGLAVKADRGYQAAS